jgi:hypothetical protein
VASGPVHQIDAASVAEVDGTGLLNACRLELAPMEIKVPGRLLAT